MVKRKFSNFLKQGHKKCQIIKPQNTNWKHNPQIISLSEFERHRCKRYHNLSQNLTPGAIQNEISEYSADFKRSWCPKSFVVGN